MATTSISLIREQTERIRPPRALWVPFALGRPLGSAEDPEFQHNVMRAAFSLLTTATEPTIEDYPIDAPDEAGPGQWSCPLNLGPVRNDTLIGRVLADDLRTLYHEAIAAQPGPGAPNHDALNDWIFGGTALGETLLAVADRLSEADDPMAKLVRGLLVPEGRYRGVSSF